MKRPEAVILRAGLIHSLLGSGVFFSSAFAQKVEVQYDHTADFSHVRRYQWRTHPVFEKNPELREVFATGIQLVLEAGNAQLMKRGLQPDDSSPDVFVTFYLLTKDLQQVKRTAEAKWGFPIRLVRRSALSGRGGRRLRNGYAGHRYCRCSHVEALWHASCGDKIKDIRKRDKNINSAVKRVLEQFPPK